MDLLTVDALYDTQKECQRSFLATLMKSLGLDEDASHAEVILPLVNEQMIDNDAILFVLNHTSNKNGCYVLPSTDGVVNYNPVTRYGSYLIDDIKTPNINQQDIEVALFLSHQRFIQPLNVSNVHWKLAFMDVAVRDVNNNAIVYIMDSASTGALSEQWDILNRLREIAKMHGRAGIMQRFIQSPQQTDGFNCGLFVIYNARWIMSNYNGTYESLLGNKLTKYPGDLRRQYATEVFQSYYEHGKIPLFPTNYPSLLPPNPFNWC
jgi:hypothetical protein